MLKLQIIGNLGKDAEVKVLQSGQTVINFSVAHTEKFKDKQGAITNKTTWVECAYWSEKTGVATYLKKGAQVYVEGVGDVRQWESNGKSGASMTCRVGMIQLIGGQGQANGQQQAASNQAAATAQQAAAQADQGYSYPMDDLPF